jgi:O-methyltransferase
MPTRTFLIRLLKSFYFSTPLWRFFLPIMKFDMTIAQLNFITSALETVKHDGAVLEIGVGGGSTSVVLNNFMKHKSIKRQFYAIDTFFGFTNEDISYEKNNRGKTNDYLGYRSNSKKWYSKTLIAHGIENAHIFQSDAKKFDYSSIGPLAFCLLDVDLYKPVEFVLPRLYEILVPDGVIIVDDCALKASIYDGAGEAYRNFCSKVGITPELAHDKLGIIRKPLS